MSAILRILATMVSLVMLMTAGIGGGQDHDVKDPATCKLNFAVLSDSHIEGNNATRYKVFARCLKDVRRNQSGLDAVVFLGDNTMNGNSTESMFFHGTVSLLLKGQKVLPALGNHDIGNGEGDYEKLQNRWYAYTEAFFDKKLTVPYYYEVIDGYYFIILGTEEHTSNSMTLTDDQLEWLRYTLEDADRSGKPAFVFSHHPERASYRADPDYAYSLTDILTAYAEDHDLFYFSGHTHRTLTRSSFQTYYNFPETSLPCLTTLTGEKDNVIKDDTGVGVEVEVYGNEVVIRGRNFYQGEWSADGAEPLEATYALKNPIA
ncbi:MAG: metallophosphoesterase [Clostridia bacterium]|nr:metallophosphoesterase [Clostridia bacterium]